MKEPVFIASYHQSRFGKLMGMTIPEIVRNAVLDTCGEIGIEAAALDVGSIGATCNLSLNEQGLLFVGHSEAGKSTIVTMLARRGGVTPPLQVEILCDDRNVVRRWPDGWRVHGTWSHGDVADVSCASAPLRAILFLQQDTRNEITPLTDRKEIWKRLLATLIKSMVTAEWWQKEMSVLEQIVNEVPCYVMRFDKSGAIVNKLVSL